MDQNESDASVNSFNFGDYMRTQDNGTIPFPDFLRQVTNLTSSYTSDATGTYPYVRFSSPNVCFR